MKTKLPPEPRPVSKAKLTANRANARLSPGPGDCSRSRFNACKHGLSATLLLPAQDTPETREFLRRALARLGPRNPLEEVCVSNLLRTRLREDLCLEVERTVLTRKPVSLAPEDDRPYPFLHDPVALKTLEALCRRLANLSRAAEKDLLALLRVRQENWGVTGPGASGAPQVAEPGLPDADAAGAIMAEWQPDAGCPPLSPADLEDCLADRRLILPDEDPQLYEALARELWATFQPADLLEAFVVSDFIQTQWRRGRVRRIEQALFERCAFSDTGDNCGVGFAFVNDSQRNQAFESLDRYEAVLRKRLEKCMALFRKLRQQGWEDAILPIPQPPAGPRPPTTSATEVSTSSAATAPDPGTTPNLAPASRVGTHSVEPSSPALGQPVDTGAAAHGHPAMPPADSQAGAVNQADPQ